MREKRKGHEPEPQYRTGTRGRAARVGLRFAQVPQKNRAPLSFALWGLVAFYAAARVLQIFPGKVPMLAVVALHVFPPALFALIHGSIFYGSRGILTFTAICLGIGNIMENIGVLTGFPFGRYYFTDVMGPKFFAVPMLLGLAYVGMGYLSWTLACLILRSVRIPLTGSRVITVPVVASFVIVAWDLCMDPVWSTIVHAWIWRQGGAYFGVPVSNFLGWYLTVYIFYQLFALYLRDRAIYDNPLPSGFWHMAVLFYGVSAAGNVLLVIRLAAVSLVSDPAGAQWKVSDITAACALTSLFIMGAFALLAWVRLGDHKPEATARLSKSAAVQDDSQCVV